MDILKRALWGAWELLLDGYAVCVALIAANPTWTFWAFIALAMLLVL